MQREAKKKRTAKYSLVKEKARPLYKLLSKAKRAGDKKEVARLIEKLEELGIRMSKSSRAQG